MAPSQPHKSTAVVLLTTFFTLSQIASAWVIRHQSQFQDQRSSKKICSSKRPTAGSLSQQYLHSAVISPLVPHGDETFSLLHHNHDDVKVKLFSDAYTRRADEPDGVKNNCLTLQRLCQHFQASPLDLLRFDSAKSDGIRGVYLNRSARRNDILLQLPLDACLVDENYPEWLSNAYDSSQWATRLAASWLDVFLKSNTENEGLHLWLSLLPDPEFLQASLPVHWPEEVVANARSTSLELAVDTAYFARAEAVQTLVAGLRSSPFSQNWSQEEMSKLAHRALDVVQTRSCRLEMERNRHCRVLAPIFDFINHGSQKMKNDNDQHVDGHANAAFTRDGNSLVVRALYDLQQDEEVLIDYGDSARPAWKCLLSYGFVPRCNDSKAEDNLAEVYMMGQRYEVSAETIPVDMVVDVAAATATDLDAQNIPKLPFNTPTGPENVVLTPEVATRIAERCEEVGFFMLLVPELDSYQNFDEEEDVDQALASLAPTEVLSHSLAASLRWSQHKVLIACAEGLRRFVAEEELRKDRT
ncbi:SET methyltransferase domain containing protein [Nitzschia inconspicua]|uniref:SET methyltransferase domain containing protein n=1 Tax=Nitzschia inconspicua TaxID=303405 RepID=A0A9K3PP21_9STRA|nr:SET methyltransferase domain containing protein [Nitzschia inconspicua]